MTIDGKPVSDRVMNFMKTAILHYIEDIEHTEVGSKFRHDYEVLTFLNEAGLETVRSKFFLETKDARCPKCGSRLNNECPGLICLEDGSAIDYVGDVARKFCETTCTQTSLEDCEVYERILREQEE